jgi:hypothetical protein
MIVLRLSSAITTRASSVQQVAYVTCCYSGKGRSSTSPLTIIDFGYA